MTSHSHARTMCNGNAVSSAFSALHLLRSYSLFGPTAEICRYEPYSSRDYNFPDAEMLSNAAEYSMDAAQPPLAPSLSSAFPLPGSLIQPPFLASMSPFMQTINMPQSFPNTTPGTVLTRQYVGTNGIASIHRRPRSEKKPIPDEQKDEKYYERRKRNNQAAKKSRDARKIREDHIALRATMLEHENAILRAQVLTLREETQSLRHMLMKQQPAGFQSIERSISTMTPVTLSPSHSTTALDCQV